MRGQLSKKIIQSFKEKFEENCISLLIESFQSVHNSGRVITDYSENDITAQLVGAMKANPKRKNLQISIDRENYLDFENTYQGLTNADKSARIDIKYNTWHTSEEYEYFMEAKNLAEDNWIKSNQTCVDAARLRKRYVETGIDNFITGKYSNGCLLGYVLQGNSDKIVEKINSLLKSAKRESEHLKSSNQYTEINFYFSDHLNPSRMKLKHFLLNFSKS
jgi:hypothetical protein